MNLKNLFSDFNDLFVGWYKTTYSTSDQTFRVDCQLVQFLLSFRYENGTFRVMEKISYQHCGISDNRCKVIALKNPGVRFFAGSGIQVHVKNVIIVSFQL